MRRVTRAILPTLVAILAGVMTLAGYIFPYPLLVQVRDEMVRWAVVIAAFAFILGFFNVLRVHLKRLQSGEKGGVYSFVLLMAALVSFGVTAGGLLVEPVQLFSDWWFNYVLVPVQAAGAGLIAFALALAAFRMMRNRRTAGTLIFLLTALVVLLGMVPLPGSLGAILANLRQWWIGVPALAGMRGLLIGVGLGTLLMGLRIIGGFDRPHSDV